MTAKIMVTWREDLKRRRSVKEAGATPTGAYELFLSGRYVCHNVWVDGI